MGWGQLTPLPGLLEPLLPLFNNVLLTFLTSSVMLSNFDSIILSRKVTTQTDALRSSCNVHADHTRCVEKIRAVNAVT